MELEIVWVITMLVVAILIILLVKSGIIIVRQAEARVIERLGKYHRTIYSGVHYKIPGIENTKKIKWWELEEVPLPIAKLERKEGVDVKEETEVVAEKKEEQPRYAIGRRVKETEVIDLRETMLDFPAQDVITKDNVVLKIDALLFFQIIDPKKAIYEIDNLPYAIEKLTQTTLRSLIGELELDETLASREIINQKLTSILDDITDKWGVKVNRVEIQKIIPPEGVIKAMHQQMKAEREKRAKILEAEGEKKSKILKAEGEAEAKIKVAEAEANAIKMVASAIKGSKGDPATYLIAVKYIEALQKMVQGENNKVIYIPYEATGVLSSLGSIKEMLEGTTKRK